MSTEYRVTNATRRNGNCKPSESNGNYIETDSPLTAAFCAVNLEDYPCNVTPVIIDVQEWKRRLDNGILSSALADQETVYRYHVTRVNGVLGLAHREMYKAEVSV
jgi:hypothetical protein